MPRPAFLDRSNWPPIVATTLVLALVLAAGCTVGDGRPRRACPTCGDDGGAPRRPPPSDPDGDADEDGLTNAEEAALGTDPWSVDTDGDGVSDLVEARGSHTDPLDRSSTIEPGDFFVVLPHEGADVVRELRFSTEIRRGDVYFLVDTTGSMDAPIASVRDSLARIAAELRESIPDLQMGVGRFEDFPRLATNPFGGGGYGQEGDTPYAHVEDVTADDGAVHAALASLDAAGGGDAPEAQVEALYQTATGEGGRWTFDNHGPLSIPARRCPEVPDEVGARRGYPCFRPGSLPIVVMVLDAQWHQDPAGDFPYAQGISPMPHTFDDAADALSAIGARYLGVTVNGGGRPEAEQMAIATGAVDVRGVPLVYDAEGGVVSDRIVEAVEALIGDVPQDVTTELENGAGNPDGVDATRFVASVRAIEGYRDGIPGARSGVSYASHDGRAFYGVIPGTLVEFAVTFRNDFRAPGAYAQVFVARIVVVGNGVATLDVRHVYVVVPGEGRVVLI